MTGQASRDVCRGRRAGHFLGLAYVVDEFNVLADNGKVVRSGRRGGGLDAELPVIEPRLSVETYTR